MRISRLILLALGAAFLFSGCAVLWKDYTPEQRRMAQERYFENEFGSTDQYDLLRPTHR